VSALSIFALAASAAVAITVLVMIARSG